MTPNTAPHVDVAETILRYITVHPDACDSLEGVCDWWLVRQRRDDAKCDVAGALAYLVAAGMIAVSDGPSGRPLYHAVRTPFR